MRDGERLKILQVPHHGGGPAILTEGSADAQFFRDLVAGGHVQPVAGSTVKPLVREASAAEQLAERIIGVIEGDAQARHGGQQTVREVVDALAIAQARLLAHYARHQPGRVDILGALLDRIREECRKAGGPDVPGSSGGPVH